MPLPLYQANSSPVSSIDYTIAIAAGKGGVGKSTLTAQLGFALQRKGLSVGILDSDLYGPSLQKMIPTDTPPYQDKDLFYPAKCRGLSLLSLAHFRLPEQAAVVRAPIANKIISQFLQNSVWGKLDILLIDFPPGTGDIQLTLCQKAKIDGAIAITTPQEIALLDVRKALKLFEQVQIPLIGIVENMSYFSTSKQSGGNEKPLYPFGRGGGQRLANEKNVPLLGEIPLDANICLFGDTGRSLWDDPAISGSPAVKAFEIIADALVSKLKNFTKQNSIALKNVSVNGTTLELIWSDDLKQNLSFQSIQKICPCAACTEKPQNVSDSVIATQISNVGQYALRFAFSQGCSLGLYSFNLLRELSTKNNL